MQNRMFVLSLRLCTFCNGPTLTDALGRTERKDDEEAAGEDCGQGDRHWVGGGVSFASDCGGGVCLHHLLRCTVWSGSEVMGPGCGGWRGSKVVFLL